MNDRFKRSRSTQAASLASPGRQLTGDGFQPALGVGIGVSQHAYSHSGPSWPPDPSDLMEVYDARVYTGTLLGLYDYFGLETSVWRRDPSSMGGSVPPWGLEPGVVFAFLHVVDVSAFANHEPSPIAKIHFFGYQDATLIWGGEVNVRGVPGVDGSAAVGMYIELVPMVGFMAPDPDYKVYSQTLTADGGLWKVQNPWDSPLEVEVQETVRCIGIYPFDTDAY